VPLPDVVVPGGEVVIFLDDVVIEPSYQPMVLVVMNCLGSELARMTSNWFF
jgi:hypothetical protein